VKKFNIKVNGKSFEVEVEEVGNILNVANSVQQPKISVAASAVTTPPAVASAPQETNQNATVPSDGEVITAPMPGKIMSIKVQVGQQVNAGDLILYLEAMKMENEIFCGISGAVKEIRVSEGSAVNPGDALVVIA